MSQPAIVLGFVRVQVIEDDVDILFEVSGDQAVHEVQELLPTSSAIVSGFDLPGDDV